MSTFVFRFCKNLSRNAPRPGPGPGLFSVAVLLQALQVLSVVEPQPLPHRIHAAWSTQGQRCT